MSSLRLGVLAAKKILPQRHEDTKNSQRNIMVSIEEFIYLVVKIILFKSVLIYNLSQVA
jgi:hypothetical protein